MAKGYWIVRVDIDDPERYKKYIAANAAPLRKYGARFLVRGGAFEGVEGGSRARNAVIGVWVGQDEIELTLVDAAGNRMAERSIVTPLKSLSNADVLKRLAQLIAKFGRETARDIAIAGIGIACQGYVDSETGGADPMLFARAVERIIAARSPRMRYVVGPRVQKVAAMSKRGWPGRNEKP